MVVQPFSISIAGKWPERKARKVIEELSDEADSKGLRLELLEVTTFGDHVTMMVIVVSCAKHHVPIVEDSACALCLQGVQ